MKNYMKNLGEYTSPISEVYIIGPQKVICNSETEHVGEDDGEW